MRVVGNYGFMQTHKNEVIVNLLIPRDLRVRLKELAARAETSVRQLAIRAFEDLLRRESAPDRSGSGPHDQAGSP